MSPDDYTRNTANERSIRLGSWRIDRSALIDQDQFGSGTRLVVPKWNEAHDTTKPLPFIQAYRTRLFAILHCHAFYCMCTRAIVNEELHPREEIILLQSTCRATWHNVRGDILRR